MTLCIAANDQQARIKNAYVSGQGSTVAPARVTPPNNLIGWLNRILVEETRCVMRYRTHYFLTLGHPKEIASVFLIHSNEKLLHVDLIALRIAQLGGTPDFSTGNLHAHAHRDFSTKQSLPRMIEENLLAERKAISFYRDLLHYLSNSDPETGDIVKNILHVDERRVTELVDWLGSATKRPDSTPGNAGVLHWFTTNQKAT